MESSILDKVLNEQNLDMHLHPKTYPVSHKEVGITILIIAIKPTSFSDTWYKYVVSMQVHNESLWEKFQYSTSIGLNLILIQCPEI